MKKSDCIYSTGQIARLAGVHRNTIILYEKWGYLPEIPRDKNGYRMYGEFHVKQMQLARIAIPGPYPGGGKPVYELVKQAAAGNFSKALELAIVYRDNVDNEMKAALEAVNILEKWAQNTGKKDDIKAISRIQAARLLHLSIDSLRTWERSGLVKIPKNAEGYCRYTDYEIDRLKIIRILRQARYSIMSILRMFTEFDKGRKSGLKELLNNPPQDDDIIYVTDHWLKTIGEHQLRAQKIIDILENKNK